MSLTDQNVKRRRRRFDLAKYPGVTVGLSLSLAAIAWLICATTLLDPTQVQHPSLGRIAEMLLSPAQYVGEGGTVLKGPSGILTLGVVLLGDVFIAAVMLRDPHIAMRTLSPPGSFYVVGAILVWAMAGIVIPSLSNLEGSMVPGLAALAVGAVLLLRGLSYPPPPRARLAAPPSE